MGNFKNYVTGGAFQLNLSRRQIDHLSFAKSHGSVINPEYASGFHTERILISKGLLEKDESNLSYALVSTGISQDFHHFDYEKLSRFISLSKANPELVEQSCTPSS